MPSISKRCTRKCSYRRPRGTSAHRTEPCCHGSGLTSAWAVRRQAAVSTAPACLRSRRTCSKCTAGPAARAMRATARAVKAPCCLRTKRTALPTTAKRTTRSSTCVSFMASHEYMYITVYALHMRRAKSHSLENELAPRIQYSNAKLGHGVLRRGVCGYKQEARGAAVS